MRTSLKVLIVLVVLVFAGIKVFFDSGTGAENTYEHERTDYKAPEPREDGALVDDRLEDKKPVFDTTLVDRRPLGANGAWLLNASDAVLRLDVPIIKPDLEQELLTLHPSYAAAVKNRSFSRMILPSVNMLDGKAKQFDDGLYAAIDLAYFHGVKAKLEGHVQLIKRIAEKAGKANIAAPYLAAGLELAGVTIDVNHADEKVKLLSDFQNDEIASKPIGIYSWNKELRTLFQFMRFFQRRFGEPDLKELAIPQSLAQILSQDKALLSDYRRMLDFYAKLSNPADCLSLADIQNIRSLDRDAVKRLAKQKQVAHAVVAIFPPSKSKEGLLFEALFPLGVPPDVNLMKELVKRIRSGEMDLKPSTDSGWYEYQVYALETLLLPEKGAEGVKLLLTKKYKERMLEAFKALVTKRRETHAREMPAARAAAAPPQPLEIVVAPRLRVEPAPTYYIRTARAYAFLANFLESAIGKDALENLHGLKKDGKRTASLHAELLWMRDLFYGLYMVSAEDIGMKTSFASDEAVDQDSCYRIAVAWLDKAIDDPDLAADARVAVPIYVDRTRDVTRVWLTLGVRLTKLDTEYVRPPSIKQAKTAGDWKPVASHKLIGANYLIPVDEFAEVEMKGMRVLKREELQAICDKEKSKEPILDFLRKSASYPSGKVLRTPHE